MRDFSWKYFSMTGDVDAYLLYKDFADKESGEPEAMEDSEADEAGSMLQ